MRVLYLLFVFSSCLLTADVQAEQCNETAAQSLEALVVQTQKNLEVAQQDLRVKEKTLSTLEKQQSATISAAKRKFGARCIDDLVKSKGKATKKCKRRSLASAKKSASQIASSAKRIIARKVAVASSQKQLQERTVENSAAISRRDQYLRDCAKVNQNPPPPDLFLPDQKFDFSEDELLNDPVPLGWLQARYVYIDQFDGANILEFKPNGSVSFTSYVESFGQCTFFSSVSSSGGGQYTFSNGTLRIDISYTTNFTQCSGNVNAENYTKQASYEVRLVRKHELDLWDLTKRTGRSKLALMFYGPPLPTFDGDPKYKVYELLG